MQGEQELCLRRACKQTVVFVHVQICSAAELAGVGTTAEHSNVWVACNVGDSHGRYQAHAFADGLGLGLHLLCLCTACFADLLG